MSADALARMARDHPFEVLLDDEGDPPDLPLLRLYGGPLQVRAGTPRVIANFVITADGVSAFGDGRGEGAMAVSLHAAADRLVMALLRSAADCVLIGAGTLREDTRHQWVPRTLMPDLAGELAVHRRQLTGSERPPALAVVTTSGSLPATHPALAQPEAEVLVITTQAGAARLPSLHPSVRVVTAGAAAAPGSDAIVEAVRHHLGASTILCEGGPHLFGRLLADGWIDELFLTVAPHLAGRDPDHSRLGLVEGVAFAPGRTPQLRLRSLRLSGDHLFARYAVTSSPDRAQRLDAGASPSRS